MKNNKKISTALVGLSLLVCGKAFAGNPPGILPDSNNRVSVAKTYPQPQMRIIGATNWSNANLGGSCNCMGESERLLITTKGPITKLAIINGAVASTAGEEVAAQATTFHKARVEYHLGVNNGQQYITDMSGNSLMTVDPYGSIQVSSPFGVYIPANTQFALRYDTYVSYPPASLTAGTAITGGNLTASTTYYYKATCVKGGTYGNAPPLSESGPTSEASATTGSTTLSIPLTWTASPLPSAFACDGTKIYRSTTSGTETYLTTVQGPALNFVDNGSNTPVSGLTPPTQPRWQYQQFLNNGDRTTSAAGGGAGADLVSGYGTSGYAATGPNNAINVSGPVAVIGDDKNSFPVCWLGDSIGMGAGIQANSSNIVNASQLTGNFVNLTFQSGSWDFLNLSVSGTHLLGFTSQNGFGSQQRLSLLPYCAYVVIELSDNDVQYGSTWQAIASARVQLAQQIVSAGGGKVYDTTLSPYGSTSDNMLTKVNYAPSANDAQRQGVNTWDRMGQQFAPAVTFTASISGTALTTSSPVNLVPQMPLSGSGLTAGTVVVSGSGTSWVVNNSQTVGSETMIGASTPCNTASCGAPVLCGSAPCISGNWDLATAFLEQNSSGVLTQNGGYWPTPCQSNCITEGVTPLATGVLTGTPTATSLPFTSLTISNAAHSLAGYVVLMTSGTQSGKSCIINDNISTTNITCTGGTNLPAAPAAGDTFDLFQTFSKEGAHPTLTFNSTIATETSPQGLQSWANANLTGF